MGGDAIWLKAFAFFFGPDCWQLSKLPSIQEIFVCGTCWLEDTKERVILVHDEFDIVKEGWISPQPPLLKFTHPPATLVGGGDAIWLKAFAFFFGPDCWQLSKLPSIQEIFVCGTCWLEDTKERVIYIDMYASMYIYI